MSIRVEYTGKYPQVILPESVDLSNSNHFKETLLNLYEEGHRVIFVDFSHVEMIDSSGLGKLLLFHKKLKDIGGELKIIRVKGETVKDMFHLIQLHKVMNIEGMTGND